MLHRYFARPTPLAVAIAAIAVIAALGVFLHRHVVLFLVLTLLLVVVAAGVVVWLFLRQIEAAKTEKAGKEIERSLDQQVEEEIQRSTFGQQAEVRNLKADWDAALAEFKRSSVGRRLGDKALAQHPMLLVIGPAGAGKTALIEESGLQSVLRDASRKPRAVRGVGGSRSFSWWFTEQAILLDMAGKTLRQSQFEDNDDWIGFLRSLRKLRPERPINGVVFAVPVSQVAGADKAATDALAETLRERARDLSHHLEMEFPCYVVLTQCDRIAGFAETFAAFGEAEAAQPWGLTVDAKAAQSTAAEDLLDREFPALVASLGDLRRVRLARLPDEAQRMRALAFPGQVEALRADLRAFLKQVFARGKDGGGGYFRGLYLTCSRVGSDTRDGVLAPAAEAVGVTPAAEPPSPEVARHAWFTQELWTRVIFRDARLASSNQSAVTREQRQRLLLVWGSAAVFVLGLLVFGVAGWNASKPVRGLKEAAAALPRSAEEARTPVLLPRLGTLRAAVAELERLHGHAGPGEWFGAYAGDRVRDAAERYYVNRVVALLIEPRMGAIHDTLAADVAGGAGGFANLFWQYQAYTLLAAPDYQLAAEDSVTLGKVMVRAYAADFARASGIAPEQLGDLMRGQMQMLSWIAGRGHAGMAPFQRFGERYDAPLAAGAVAELQRRWSEAPRLYDDMIEDANRTTKPLGLELVLKDAHRPQRMLREAAPLPGAFTRAGWEHRVRPRLDVLLSMVDRDKVLQAQLGGSLKDFAARFRDQYADACVSAWVTWLRGITAHRDPEDENQREALKREGRGGEIDAVIRRTEAETHAPGSSAPPQIAARFSVVHGWLRRPTASWPDRVRDRIPFIMTDQHRSPHQRWLVLIAKAGKDAAGIAGESYSSAQNTVYNYNPDSADAGVQSALRHTLLVMKAGGSDGALGSFNAAPGGGAGGPAGAGGGGGAFDMARFEADWGAAIVQAYPAQVGAFYPFQPGAPEITLQAFAAFFGPGGNVDHMYQTYMRGFMDPSGHVNNAPAALPPGQLAWMQKAMRIQAAFFPGGAKDPSVQFDVKTNARNNSPAGLHVVAWHVGAGDFTYEMGGEEPMSLEWSAATAAQGSRVNADLNGTPIDGPSSATQWGLFKVLDAAQLSPVNGRHVMARWSFGGVTMRVEIMPRTEVHPFVEGFFRIGAPPPVAQP